MEEKTSVIVIGLGFVGLACFAGFKSLGINTYGYEVDKRKITSILKLKGDLIEPDIKDYLSDIENLDKLIASELPQITDNSHICALICVGTPSDSKGRADLTHVKKAIKQVVEIGRAHV